MNKMFTRRVVSAFIILALLLFANVNVFAAPPQKIKNVVEDFATKLETIVVDGESFGIEEKDNLAVAPGSQIIIPLSGKTYRDLFLDQNDSPIPCADVTHSRLVAGKVKLEDYNDENIAQASWTFSYSADGIRQYAPAIEINISEFAAERNSRTFYLGYGLSIDGSSKASTFISIGGTVSPIEILATANYEEITLPVGGILSSESDLNKVNITLGDTEVGLISDLISGAKYYASANSVIDEYYALVETNSDIVDVIQISQSGFNTAKAKVVFMYDQNYYVYNSSGEYIGRSYEELEFDEFYYIFAKKLPYIE